MLSQDEIDYYRAKLRGPDVDTRITNALANAREYVETYAADMLPMIQAGVARAVFLYTIQPDDGERELLRMSIDNLIQLGRATKHDASTSRQ